MLDVSNLSKLVNLEQFNVSKRNFQDAASEREELLEVKRVLNKNNEKIVINNKALKKDIDVLINFLQELEKRIIALKNNN